MSECFKHDSLSFHYVDIGRGVPFVFQHGLGGDAGQPAGLFQPPAPGIRFISFDCRGHGDTRPLGDPAKLEFSVFADDLRALLDHLGVAQAIIGGVSMGAGVALRFTLSQPHRVLGLVLSRPAWLDQPLPDNLKVLPRIAELIRAHGAKEGLSVFQQRFGSTNDALIQQFTHPRAEETVAKLERVPNDVPNRDRTEWASIRVPTLVLGSSPDQTHPLEYAETLARSIPGATLRRLTPKSIDPQRHAAETRRFLHEFFVEKKLLPVSSTLQPGH